MIPARIRRREVTEAGPFRKLAAAEVKKRCKVCKELKPVLEDFYLNSSGSDYLNICKRCKKDDVTRRRKIRLPGTNTEVEKSAAFDQPVKPPGDPAELNLPAPIVMPEKQHYSDYGIELPDLPDFIMSEHYIPTKHYTSVALSARNTGKSNLYGAYHKEVVRKNYDLNVVYCNSLSAPIYSEIFTPDEKRLCSEKYNRKSLRFLEEIQKRTNNAFHFHATWDDCIDFNSQKNSEELVQIYTRGRNKNHTSFFSTQAVTAVAKPARGNIDFLYFGRVNVNEAWEQVVETLFRGLIGFGIPLKLECQFWHDLIHKKFEPYTFLVIDYLGGGKLYKYKAEKIY